jgi:hypothetical protein
MELSLHAATVHVPRHVTGISVPMLASYVVAIAHGFASQGRVKKQRKGGGEKQSEDGKEGSESRRFGTPSVCSAVHRGQPTIDCFTQCLSAKLMDLDCKAVHARRMHSKAVLCSVFFQGAIGPFVMVSGPPASSREMIMWVMQVD